MIPISQEECRDLQISMLKEIDSFCKTHNLTYFLAFGTLIGAVRHKGFIPWDDDIDIMMPRKDYESFERLFPFGDKYRFLTKNNTNKFPYAFGKVIDARTIKEEPLRAKYQVIGLDIDVFPIDNYPEDLEETEEWCHIISTRQVVLNKTFLPFSHNKKLLSSLIQNAKIATRHLLDDIGVCSVKQLVSQIDSLSQKYNGKDSKYCGIAAISTYGARKRNRKDIYSSSVDLSFEGFMFPAPIGYHEYLTDIYGNYMQLPPVEKRITHHVNKIFWK